MESRSVVAREPGRGRLAGVAHKEICSCHGNSMHLASGADWSGESVCQNSSKRTFKVGVFYCIQVVPREFFLFKKQLQKKRMMTVKVKIIRLTGTAPHKQWKPEDNIMLRSKYGQKITANLDFSYQGKSSGTKMKQKHFHTRKKGYLPIANATKKILIKAE